MKEELREVPSLRAGSEGVSEIQLLESPNTVDDIQMMIKLQVSRFEAHEEWALEKETIEEALLDRSYIHGLKRCCEILSAAPLSEAYVKIQEKGEHLNKSIHRCSSSNKKDQLKAKKESIVYVLELIQKSRVFRIIQNQSAQKSKIEWVAVDQQLPPLVNGESSDIILMTNGVDIEVGERFKPNFKNEETVFHYASTNGVMHNITHWAKLDVPEEKHN